MSFLSCTGCTSNDALNGLSLQSTSDSQNDLLLLPPIISSSATHRNLSTHNVVIINTPASLCCTVELVRRAILQSGSSAPLLDTHLITPIADFCASYLENKAERDLYLFSLITSQQDPITLLPFIHELLVQFGMRNLFSHLPPNLFVSLLEMSLATSFSLSEFETMLNCYPFDSTRTAGENLLKAAFQQKSPYLLYWISLFPTSTVTSFLQSIAQDGAAFLSQLEACTATSDLENIFNYISAKPDLDTFITAFDSLLISINNPIGTQSHILLKGCWNCLETIATSYLSNESKSNDIYFSTLRQIPPLMIKLWMLISPRKTIISSLFGFLSAKQQCFYTSTLQGGAYCLTLENSPQIKPSFYPLVFQLSSPSQVLRYLKYRLFIYSEKASRIQDEKTMTDTLLTEYCNNIATQDSERLSEIEHHLEFLQSLIHSFNDPITQALCTLIQNKSVHFPQNNIFVKWQEISSEMEKTLEKYRIELQNLTQRVSPLKKQ